MDHIADSLAIHPAVVDLAKVEFSRFRDVREAIQQYDGVVASCLALAFQELSGRSDLDVSNRAAFPQWSTRGLTLTNPLAQEALLPPPNVACVGGDGDACTTVLNEVRLRH